MTSLEINEQDSLDWKVIFLIGLGFFTTGISWALYNSFVPLWLNDFIDNRTTVGFIMGLDNLAMIFMEPIVGTYSDKTKTRFGRRIPYLMIGIPVSGFFLTLLPLFKDTEVYLLMLVIIAFLLMMAFYRAPVVALMPDLVPSKFRSKANGIINLMGGLGAVYAFAFGSIMYAMDPLLAFGSTAIIMLLALALLMFYVKEPEIKGNQEAKKDENLKSSVDYDLTQHSVINSLKEVLFDKDKSGLYVLLAIFFWFLAFNALETWFTSWALETLPYVEELRLQAIQDGETIEKAKEIAEAASTFLLTAFSLIFVLFAIPAGLIGQKIGRANTIKIGIPWISTWLLIGYILIQTDIISLGANSQYYMFMVILAFAALGWAMININSIVIVWEIGGDKKLGSYTGVYYLFASSAAVLGPGLIGLIFDLFGGGTFNLLIPVTLLCFVIAFLMMLGVKSGEVNQN
jgi:MFS family permease